jgi:hypothetical protein
MPHVYVHLLQVQPFWCDRVAFNVKWSLLLLHIILADRVVDRRSEEVPVHIGFIPTALRSWDVQSLVGRFQGQARF